MRICGFSCKFLIMDQSRRTTVAVPSYHCITTVSPYLQCMLLQRVVLQELFHSLFLDCSLRLQFLSAFTQLYENTGYCRTSSIATNRRCFSSANVARS